MDSSANRKSKDYYYRVLQLQRDASPADVKRAFRRLVLIHHPDKGGDAEKFKDLSKANEVLSDPDKRKVYDLFGDEAIRDSGFNAPSDHIFGTSSRNHSAAPSSSSSSHGGGGTRFAYSFFSSSAPNNFQGASTSRKFTFPDLFEMFIGKLPRMNTMPASGTAFHRRPYPTRPVHDDDDDGDDNDNIVDELDASPSANDRNNNGTTETRLPPFPDEYPAQPRSFSQTPPGSGSGSGSRSETARSNSPLHKSAPAPSSDGGVAASGNNRPTDILFTLDVSVHDLYTCAKKKLKIRRTIVCYGCAGLGGHQNKCPKCQGVGSYLPSVTNSGITAPQQMRTMCDHCDLTGFVLDPMCDVCKGNQKLTVSSLVTVQLRPGQDVLVPLRVPLTSETCVNVPTPPSSSSVLPSAPHSQSSHSAPSSQDFFFCAPPSSSLSSEAPNVVTPPGSSPPTAPEIFSVPGGVHAGDLVVHLRELPHPIFQHFADHLLVQKTISLSDALSGTQFVFTHLDERQFVVQSSRVVQSGSIQVLRGYGMPRSDGMTRGNLYFRFNVEFPEHLSEEAKRVLRTTLPGSTSLPTFTLPLHVATLEVDDNQLAYEMHNQYSMRQSKRAQYGVPGSFS